MDVDAHHVKIAKSELLRILDAALASVLPGSLVDQQVSLVVDNDGDEDEEDEGEGECVENSDIKSEAAEDDGGESTKSESIRRKSSLLINGQRHELGERVYCVGFGKAVAGMARSLERTLGDRLVRGIVSVPRVSLCHRINRDFELLHRGTLAELQSRQMLMRSPRMEYREGAADNQPDGASIATTEAIVELVEGLGEGDTLLVLVSGGGSALLCGPRPPLGAEEKIEICRGLQNAGASIGEVNAVRKQLSSVKGGELARLAYPARVLTLVLSDVVGDRLDTIASGPTYPIVEENAKAKAIDILKQYGIYKQIGEEVQQMLASTKKESAQDKAMMVNGKFKHVENVLIGNNKTALLAAQQYGKNYDLKSIILTHTVEGNVKDVSYAYAKLAKLACLVLQRKLPNLQDFLDEVLRQNIGILNIAESQLEELYEGLGQVSKNKGLLLLCGGEPTVVVEGDGKGGRNQELALHFSMDWLGQLAKEPQLASFFVMFLSAGTDGQDGPTDAAGAFAQPGLRPKLAKLRRALLEQKKTTPECEMENLVCRIRQVEAMLPENVLRRNDSYNFFSRVERGENLVKTGLTGTNVMDLHFIYIKKRNCECAIDEVLNYKHDSEIVEEDFDYFTFIE